MAQIDQGGWLRLSPFFIDRIDCLLRSMPIEIGDNIPTSEDIKKNEPELCSQLFGAAAMFSRPGKRLLGSYSAFTFFNRSRFSP